MARAWRIEYEGALYHVLSRGNERRDIFLDDDDRTMFLTGLGLYGDNVEIMRYLNELYNARPQFFPTLLPERYSTIIAEFYANQPIVLTLPLKA